MKVYEVMSILNEELKNEIFPICNNFEKVKASLGIATLTYIVGKKVTELSPMLTSSGILSPEGDMDLEYLDCLIDSLPYPLEIDFLKFNKEDLQKILSKIKEKS